MVPDLRFLFLSFCCAFLALHAAADSDNALVDPTRPINAVVPKATAAAVEQKPLQLQAIYLGEGSPRAVVNGRLVKAGETVDQARVIAINSNGVTYVRNGERRKIELLPTILQPVKVEE